MDREDYLEKLKESIDLLSDILDTENYGMCLVDREGRIIKWNYEKLFERREEDVLGLPVWEVLENTRLHIVAQTGEKELFQLQKIHGNTVIANRIPIILDGETVGAAGTIIYKDTKELADVWHHVERIENSMKAYRSELARMYQACYQFDDILTENPHMNELKELCKVVAPTQATVLLQGESGTGKELFAQAIHNASLVHQEPFVSINCASIPKDLLESELFGYEPGAFTGARKEGKIGKLELAGNGTLFLDELGNMPLQMQVKLLRVLESREYERVGGNKKRTLQARLIAATNEQLSEAVAQGRFRSDLYYRLSVVNIEIPPLRSRPEDLPVLCTHMLLAQQKKYNLGRIPAGVSEQAMSVLQEYRWPGNVRELRNVMERAVIMSQGHEIRVCHLPDELCRQTKAYRSGGENDAGKTENASADRFLAMKTADETPAGGSQANDKRYPCSISADGPDAVLMHTHQMEEKMTDADIMDVDESKTQSFYYRNLENLERKMILEALEEAGGNRTQAAKQLGIHRSVIYKKMKDLGITGNISSVKQK